MLLKSITVETPLGPMIAIADDHALYLLEFADKPSLQFQLKKLSDSLKSPIISGKNTPLHLIETELHSYFAGSLSDFSTPLHPLGTPFQKNVWDQLAKIPFGQTKSYASLASAIQKPTASRAVANANGANQLAIIIPCHRIINSNGSLGGYSGGIQRKQWLVNHEKKYYSKSPLHSVPHPTVSRFLPR